MKIAHTLLFTILLFSYGYSQPYEIQFDTRNATGWFGGDNGPGQARNVAVAQSVFIDNSIELQSFAFYFAARFDSSINPTGTGHEVRLKLHVRDSLGAVLRTEQVDVPDTFNGGWVTWPNINLSLVGPGKFIFSTYLVGGYDSIKVTSYQSCDANAGYPGGERYAKYVVNDSDAVAWADWSGHPWDSAFWLTGTLNPTGINEKNIPPGQFGLEQNYPNPFNPATEIRFQISEAGLAALNVYDLLGREVTKLVNEVKQPGSYKATFDARSLASGVYFYKLQTGNFTATKRMLLIK